ncbi:MAG: UDP-N-acetyl-D-mannosamine dehydrogenase [Candidatus Acidiferrum sp.]
MHLIKKKATFMPLTIENSTVKNWQLRKIGVIGPGIVGMPMAAMLAGARIREGTEQPASVLVVQRDSPTSAWKVNAINSGVSPIRGIEPELDLIVRKAVNEGLLSATHDCSELWDADMVLVCVQTDKKGLEPDYGPLFSSLEALALALKSKPMENIPLIVIESTLAPSTMTTLIRDHFAAHRLVDGRDILLGFSPNRVMPGRLVERVRTSDKLVSGLLPTTPRLIRSVYSKIVTSGKLFETNTMTAEIEKTTENAYRDVRIAYSSEIARFCDQLDVDFFQLRDAVNDNLGQTDLASGDSNAVPSGGMLVPTVGVGGHCLPKDGILLWWRRLESGDRSATSLIEQSRRINDASPNWTIGLAESLAGDLRKRNVSVLGAAYRFNSEDTRNSPSLALAKLLLDKGANVTIHDPYVNIDDQNLKKFGLVKHFTNDLSSALQNAEVLILCTAHHDYTSAREQIVLSSPRLSVVVDACNLWSCKDFDSDIRYGGIGRGSLAPVAELIDFVTRGFRIVEHGFARELNDTIDFLNSKYAHDDFSMVKYSEIQKLAATCSTGCQLADPISLEELAPFDGFMPTLVDFATPKSYSAKL